MTLVVLSLLGACTGRALEGPEPLPLALDDVEALFQRRAEPGALDQTIALAWKVLDEFPEQPEVLAVLARAYDARGYGHGGEQALDDFSQSYRLSHRCLARNPGWKGRLNGSGGRLERDVTSRLLSSDRPCLETALLALAHHTAERGPAGWVDLRELGLLAEAALALDVEEKSWIPPWAVGMTNSLPAFADADAREAGAEAFREASRREPELITPVIDRLTHAFEGGEDGATRTRAFNAVRQRYSPVRPDDVWALENRRGLERLEVLQDAH